MADQTEDGDVITQRFTGGEVSWNSSTNDFTTQPSNLASSLSGLEVPGAEQPQAPSTPLAASDANGTNWFAPQWWWLLILVPVLLLLLGLVFGALWRNRRQGCGESVGYEAPDDSELRADAARPYAPAVAVGHGSADDQDQDLSAPVGERGFGPEISDATAEDRGDRIGEIPDGEEDEFASLSFQEDPDAIDTAPTRIESDDEIPFELDEPTRTEWDDETPSGQHAAVEIDEPAAARMAFHLPLDDPYQAPEGYPVKADTQSGLYWTPDSGLYDDARAEISFASEEFARTNGFVRAD